MTLEGAYYELFLPEIVFENAGESIFIKRIGDKNGKSRYL